MERIKQIAKYTTNVLAIIAALVSGINAVEGITIPYAIQIVQVIAVIQGVIGTYLLGNKAVESVTVKSNITEETLDTQVIPILSDEEADNREYELIDKSEEGGL